MKKNQLYNVMQKYSYYIVIAVFFGILFIRNYYSFCWSDESLYLSNVYRLYQGDALFIDEWNFTMLSAYIWLPVFSLYKLINGTAGIYLFFRNLYLVQAFLTSLYVYWSLKSIRKNSALLCALVVLTYSRANIMGCSYYNVGMLYWVLTTLTVYNILRTPKDDQKNVYYLILPLFMFISVMQNPYLLPGCLVDLGVLLTRKDKKIIFTILVGCTICLGMCFVFFSHAGLSEYINGLKNIVINSVQETNIQKVCGFFSDIKSGFDKTWINQVVLLLFQVIVAKFKKKKKLQLVLYYIGASLSSVLFVYNLYSFKNNIGKGYLALCIWLLQIVPMFLAQLKREILRKALYFIVSGVYLSFAFRFASNNGLDAICIGFVLVVFGPILIFGDATWTWDKVFADGKAKLARIVNVAWTANFVAVFLMTFFLRIFGVYRDATIDRLTTYIDQGPAKGIYTTQAHYEQYMNVYRDVTQYVKEDSSVFIGKLAPWAYLCAPARCAAPTTWRLQLDDPALERYYQTHEMPQTVFVLKEEYGGFEDNFIPTWGENGDPYPNYNSLDNWFINELETRGYEMVQLSCGVMYHKGT